MDHLCLVCLFVLSILEIIIFQQVFVNLLLDLQTLKLCQQNSSTCDISNHVKSSAYYILTLLSVINILLHITNLCFIYVVRSRLKNGRNSSFKIYFLDLPLLSDIVLGWSIFKIFFTLLLLLRLLNQEESSLTLVTSTGIYDVVQN